MTMVTITTAKAAPTARPLALQADGRNPQKFQTEVSYFCPLLLPWTQVYIYADSLSSILFRYVHLIGKLLKCYLMPKKILNFGHQILSFMKLIENS